MTQRPLSPRQREALQRAANGESQKQIVDGMGIAYGTVRTHMRLAYRALGARDEAHAVAIAMRTKQIV